MIKDQLVPAKDWIIENQNKSGSICWDHRGKCDPWDLCTDRDAPGALR